jgi:hypothetical protein
MCTADRAIPSSHLSISTALPTCHLKCMSNKLIFLILYGCVYVFSGNSLHAAQSAYFTSWAWSVFPKYGRGRSRPLSFVVLMQPCLHIMLVLYSDLVNMCTDYLP